MVSAKAMEASGVAVVDGFGQEQPQAQVRCRRYDGFGQGHGRVRSAGPLIGFGQEQPQAQGGAADTDGFGQEQWSASK